MGYLKHNGNGNKTTKKKQAKPQPSEPPQPIADADTAYSGLSAIAEQLENLFKQVGAYVHDATLGEHSLHLFTPNNSPAVRLELEGDAIETIADSLKRIADTMAGEGGSKS